MQRWLGWAGAAAGVAIIMQVRRALRTISLTGRTVVVTGGSRGLGLLLAREFSLQGARVAVCARDPEELARARDLLASEGIGILAVPCNLADDQSVQDFVAEVRDRLGPVDVLVNNAGVIQVGPAESMTPDDFRRAMDVHFWAPLRMTYAVLPDMRSRRQGRIVNISSIGGLLGVPHMLAYTASKFALTGLSEGLREELAHLGILVTTVFPGPMRTGSPSHGWFKGKYESEYAWFSVTDSLPGLSIDARRAARRIVNAARTGRPRLVLGLQAVAAAWMHALAPGSFVRLMQAANKMLPGPTGSMVAVSGKDSETRTTRSALTALSRAAAARNNE